MKSGTLALTFKNGIVVDATVGAGLQESYDRLFESARHDLSTADSDVDAGVRVVVFGCMLIEALATAYLERLVRASAIPDLARPALWAVIERSPSVQKLQIVAGFDDESATSDWIGPVARAFQIRNKLVHFRESLVQIPAPTDVHSVGAWAEEVPEADLIMELRPPRIERTVSALVGAKLKLEAIHHQHFPTTKIPLSQSSTEASCEIPRQG